MSCQPVPLSSLEFARKAAKRLLRSARGGDSDALARLNAHVRPPVTAETVRLAQVQFTLAREHGHVNWGALANELSRQATMRLPLVDVAEQLLHAAMGHGWDRPQRELARRILAARPEVIHVDPACAALAGDWSALEPQLASVPDVNDAEALRFGTPLLAVAAASVGSDAGTVEVLHQLVKRGADVMRPKPSPEYPDGNLTPLYFAAGIASNAVAVRWLLAAGADPNDGESLYHAVEHPNRDVIAALVEAGAQWEPANAVRRLLDFEDPERLEWALALGADPVGQPGTSTPLHHALLRGRSTRMLNRLVEAGADPRMLDASGTSAYTLARRLGATEFAEGLEARGLGEPLSPDDAFLAAVAAGNLEQARQRLQELPGGREGLPAHHPLWLPHLAQIRNEGGVRVLLALGWSVSTAGDWGASALNQAAFNGDEAVARLLLAHGARYDEPNAYGGDAWGSVQWSSRNGGATHPGHDHVAVAQAFLEAGFPIPDPYHASDEVNDVLDEWLERHPDWPRYGGS